MSLDDFLSLTDDGLRAKYEAKPVDHAALRKPFIKALKTAIDQFENGRTKAPNRLWTGKGDTVLFVPKFKGNPVVIGGKTEHFIPSDRFVEAVQKIIAAVESGELDDALFTDDAPVAAKATRAEPSDPLVGIRRSFGIRMGKQGVTAKEAAAAIEATGKYRSADVAAVLKEKS